MSNLHPGEAPQYLEPTIPMAFLDAFTADYAVAENLWREDKFLYAKYIRSDTGLAVCEEVSSRTQLEALRQTYGDQVSFYVVKGSIARVYGCELTSPTESSSA